MSVGKNQSPYKAPKMFRRHLGAMIHEYRCLLGLSEDELAKAIQQPSSAVHLLEQGDVDVAYDY